MFQFTTSKTGKVHSSYNIWVS